MDIRANRESPNEKARLIDLMKTLPQGRRSVLEIGARDGHYSKHLAAVFPEVTALDLVKPAFELEGVTTVQGDVTGLQFPDDSFDAVLCSEVLEHIPPALLLKAASELKRVARYEVVIGVPYRQDTRFGSTSCTACGAVNPPWGHVNAFHQGRLRELFAPLQPFSTSFVGSHKERTNFLSAWLMTAAGNPWGTYDQEEPCVRCGARMLRPDAPQGGKRALVRAASLLNRVQNLVTAAGPIWIHMAFRKRSFESAGPERAPSGAQR